MRIAFRFYLFIFGIFFIKSYIMAFSNHEMLKNLGLNVKEYPDDDFSHILGVNDPGQPLFPHPPILFIKS